MKQVIVSTFFLFVISIFANAQKSKITGKVFNNSNQPLTGVTIILAGTSTATTTTNIDGIYSIFVDVNKKHSLTFSYIGYETKTISNIQPARANDVEVLDILMVENKTVNSEVTVKASTKSSGKGETVNAMIAYQKNTGTVASVVSAETIKRSPDRTTGEVLKRTPGASIQEGKFIIVRGLADRYNQAMLNGVLLTSTEPDRKTFSFDLIPSAMIDNIIINKAFVPELPGEWAGGLIQVNTKDMPAKNYLNIQLGTGFNTQTIGENFYTDNAGSLEKTLGYADASRSLPSSYTTKSNFDLLSASAKTAIGKQLRNAWEPTKINAPLNSSLQINGGLNTKIFGKKVGVNLGVLYNKNNRFLKVLNRQNTLSANIFTTNFNFDDDRYVQEISAGAIGSFTIELNSKNKISLKSLINLNSSNSTTLRTGVDFTRDENIKGNEMTFKQNIFNTTQLIGEHALTSKAKLTWYGSFNILDGFIPDQRRILYTQAVGTNNPYTLALSNTLSQQSGSRIFQNLSDYIYTAGGNVAYNVNMFNRRQTIKVGYMFQAKDRLYDAQLFANYLPTDNTTLRLLTPSVVFNAENFGNGVNNKFAFNAIKGNTFRYLANTILNAGFIQFDNSFSPELRVVWGVRVENYDQLIGSVKKYDPRHTYSQVNDFLPGINATYKLNTKTNLRLSASQTVIRPELRELSALNLYDFELNASVQGYPDLLRTKITNLDARYELYPATGEMITAGIFYKDFQNPIEQIFSEGAGGASTFTYRNAAKAYAYGIEVEFRKKLSFITTLKNFTVQANAAYIHSRIQDSKYQIDRPLQGQSPYTVNVSLLYDLPKHDFTASVLFNQVGQRIYLVGDLTSGSASPDIWEAPRPILDLQLSKKVLKQKAEIKLNISDIINQTQYFYQNADGNKTSFQKNTDAYRFTRRFGTTFSLTVNYSL